VSTKSNLNPQYKSYTLYLHRFETQKQMLTTHIF